MTHDADCSFSRVLSEFTAGNLPAADHDLVLRHIEQCDRCRQQLDGLGPPGPPDGQPGPVPPSRLDRFLPLTPTRPGRRASPNVAAAGARPDAGGRLDQFEILGVIGRGGMGVVLKARDTVLDRIVAIKVLGLTLANHPEGRQRFMREARSAAAVSHEHVVTVHGFGGVDADPYLVMEYVEGRSLHDHLGESGPLPVGEVVRLGAQIADGLAAAHSRGLIHRDVKPGNILLEGATGRVKITDFGLARAVDDGTLSRTGHVCGTAHYIAPEQALGADVDHRADLFSLGTVLYEMLTGELPFDAPRTMAILRRVCDEPARPVAEHRPDAPPWLAELISRLHAKDPAARPRSAAEVADALRQGRLPPESTHNLRPADRPGRAVPRVPRARRFVLAALPCLAFLVGLPAFYFLAGPGGRLAARPQPAAHRLDGAAPAALVEPARRDEPKGRPPAPAAPPGDARPAPPQTGRPAPAAAPARPPADEGVVELTANSRVSAGFVALEGVHFRHRQSRQVYVLREGLSRLPAGVYDLDMPFTPPDLTVQPASFSLLRGGTADIRVQHEYSWPPRPEGAGGPFPPGKKGPHFPPPGR